VLGEHVAQVIRHALAEREVHAARMVDVQANRSVGLLGEQHLDLRLGSGEPALDVLLHLADHSTSGEKKVGCEAHLQVRHSGRR
jgi:hypothetical protein